MPEKPGLRTQKSRKEKSGKRKKKVFWGLGVVHLGSENYSELVRISRIFKIFQKNSESPNLLKICFFLLVKLDIPPKKGWVYRNTISMRKRGCRSFRLGNERSGTAVPEHQPTGWHLNSIGWIRPQQTFGDFLACKFLLNIFHRKCLNTQQKSV